MKLSSVNASTTNYATLNTCFGLIRYVRTTNNIILNP